MRARRRDCIASAGLPATLPPCLFLFAFSPLVVLPRFWEWSDQSSALVALALLVAWPPLIWDWTKLRLTLS